MTITATERLSKQPSESRLYAIDFVNLLATGETISSVTSVVGTPSGLTIGSPTISGTQVLFRVSGGVEGVLYSIVALIRTSLSNTLEGDGILEVENLGTVETMPSAIITVDDVRLELGITSPTNLETNTIQQAITRAMGAVRRHLHYDPMQNTRTEYYPQFALGVRARDVVWDVSATKSFVREVGESASNELQLQHLPIRSITSLYVDYDARNGTRTGAFSAENLKVQGTDYWPNFDVTDVLGSKACRDGILQSQGMWPTEPGCVKVTYVAGYTNDEFRGSGGVLDASPIWETVLSEASRRSRRSLVMGKGSLGLRGGALTSESLGSYSYSVEAGSMNKLFGGDLSGDSIERLSGFVNFGWTLSG
jgi:hypothetical protein